MVPYTGGMSKEPKPDEIELRPDGEERFRAAVHAAAKSGKKPRPPAPTPKKSVVKRKP